MSPRSTRKAQDLAYGYERARKYRVCTRSIMLALSCAAVMIGSAPAALAKGPSQAIIEGPGMSATSLRPAGQRTIGEALATLIQESGFFSTLDGADAPWRHQRPVGELGARYVVTYSLGGGDDSASIVQYVYPYAFGGPVTYMPPDQRYWGRETTTGGWHRADAALKGVLAEVGVPRRPSTDALETTPSPPEWIWYVLPLVVIAGTTAIVASALLRTSVFAKGGTP